MGIECERQTPPVILSGVEALSSAWCERDDIAQDDPADPQWVFSML